MHQVEHSEPAASVAKAAALWTGAGLGQTTLSWGDLAAMLAAVYSVILIGEWVWRRLMRPTLQNFGVVKPRRPQPQPPADTGSGVL